VIEVKESIVSEDAVLGGRVRLFQPVTGYRAAIDPVLLAASIQAGAGDKVLDVGCGVGAAALCLATRVAEVRVSGIEVQRDLVRLAMQNVGENAMTGRVDIMRGDLLAPPPRLAPGGFDHVMANPPFEAAGTGNVPPDASKAVASVEGEADLADWVSFCLRMVRRKGSVTFIHRADRLDELLAAMREGLGELAVFPLWPGISGKAAKRVLVRGRKGVSGPLAMMPGLVLHGEGGAFTPEADVILRDAGPLKM
jgi:tRNA1(Val) A37 N6-methylase TrmN6